ncbi:MAG: undecaprenyl-diphosphate phosphatase [SAR116 cluster bacterium]|nr:MAG: undecaprenyl-diphosphate phosphatase [SAR116 cluster bacterium]
MAFSFSDFSYYLLLALVQGITEFLPVSSSGHLVLVPSITNRSDHGVSIDVAAHIGTLIAVMIYVRSDLIKMTLALRNTALKSLRPNANILIDAPSLMMIKMLIIATIPVIIAGFLVSLFEPDMLRLVQTVAISNIIFAIFLWHSDKTSPSEHTLSEMGLKQALFIGLAQMLALIPGTSRSGVTMTMARYLGFERLSAARFSLLLSIPVIIAAGCLQVVTLIRQEDIVVGAAAIYVAIFSCIIALGAIHGMMKWLGRANFNLFVYYRFALGLVLLIISF